MDAVVDAHDPTHDPLSVFLVKNAYLGRWTTHSLRLLLNVWLEAQADPEGAYADEPSDGARYDEGHVQKVLTRLRHRITLASQHRSQYERSYNTFLAQQGVSKRRSTFRSCTRMSETNKPPNEPQSGADQPRRSERRRNLHTVCMKDTCRNATQPHAQVEPSRPARTPPAREKRKRRVVKERARPTYVPKDQSRLDNIAKGDAEDRKLGHVILTSSNLRPGVAYNERGIRRKPDREDVRAFRLMLQCRLQSRVGRQVLRRRREHWVDAAVFISCGNLQLVPQVRELYNASEEDVFQKKWAESNCFDAYKKCSKTKRSVSRLVLETAIGWAEKTFEEEALHPDSDSEECDIYMSADHPKLTEEQKKIMNSVRNKLRTERNPVYALDKDVAHNARLDLDVILDKGHPVDLLWKAKRYPLIAAVSTLVRGDIRLVPNAIHMCDTAHPERFLQAWNVRNAFDGEGASPERFVRDMSVSCVAAQRKHAAVVATARVHLDQMLETNVPANRIWYERRPYLVMAASVLTNHNFYSMFDYLAELQTRLQCTPDEFSRWWCARDADPSMDADASSNITAPAEYIERVRRVCLREEYGSDYETDDDREETGPSMNTTTHEFTADEEPASENPSVAQIEPYDGYNWTCDGHTARRPDHSKPTSKHDVTRTRTAAWAADVYKFYGGDVASDLCYEDVQQVQRPTEEAEHGWCVDVAAVYKAYVDHFTDCAFVETICTQTAFCNVLVEVGATIARARTDELVVVGIRSR
ncbi:hypothetical protein CYMTET_40945 [Cymbomonas tetramitiformis]|uniref:Uncharacterized protein n=1 Tax=Cymbomonas tetramitiformis TaxID=36881 RepID=A0AAE0C8W6_9CHLO|nr:hypothetical protein CYMTET_40945 [Cymbomonas tetramitiformis]|eukprot:gene241-425_t